MPKTLRKFHILDSFLLLRVKKDVPQNLRFATHPEIVMGKAKDHAGSRDDLALTKALGRVFRPQAGKN